MKSYKTIINLFFTTLLLFGCNQDAVKDNLTSDSTAVDADPASQSYAYGNDAKATELNLDKNSNATEGSTLDPEISDISNQLSKRTIYFEYDSSQILDKFIALVETHAQYLIEHPNRKMTLEGHSDERGTREYNIALAEQRAKSVFNRMQSMGVMRNQLDIVSYGEEKPVAFEYNEVSYALNRRVEIIYK